MSFFFGPGGFPGMGGMPGGMPGGMGGDDESDGGEASSNTKYYELLGIDKSASQQQIKKSYRKLAREVHPDKHPDEAEKYHEKFQELQKAYEVLSDPEKKTLYDRYGEAGLKLGSGGGGGGGGQDIFDMFFGGGHGHGHGQRGGGRGQQQQRRRKAPPIQQFLDVTLEDLYLGSSRVINYEKMTICGDCGGKGGKKVTECSACHGNGVQVIMKQMGYMTVQTQRECPHCNGEGTSIPESAKCKKCEGKGMKKVSKKIDFAIPRGSKHAEKVVMKGQGHEIPDAGNGDLVLVLRCVKHELYQRIGADLAMTKKISLRQALCGCTTVIEHLSGFKLKIKTAPNEVIQHGSLKAVYSKGMPQKGSGGTFGHLYVKFEIVFPDQLDEEAVAALKQLLPLGDDELDPDAPEPEPEHKHHDNEDEEEEEDEDYEIHETSETIHGEPKVTPASARSAYDEDEEEEGGQQCRQM